MIEDIKHFKINWIDGMKISKEHFQHLQDFAESRVKDSASAQMGRHGYGLLTSHLSENSEYAVNIDAHKGLKISIQKLRALTPNGNRIEITQHTLPVKEEVIVEEFADKKFEEGYVLLNFDNENPVSFGEQNPKEIPPRHPFITANYFFSFANTKDLEKSGLGMHQIKFILFSRSKSLL